MRRFLLFLSFLLSLCVYESSGQRPSLAFSQDEPSTSKHRHAVEHLEPDPAKTIFNGVTGKNPLERTTAAPRAPIPNKKHAGNVIIRRGRRSTDKKENLDREYDVLVSDFDEDEKPESVPKDQAVVKPADVTMEPTKWTTRVVGSAEILDPRAIEAPIHQHRVAVPAHLVERVRESLETEETEKSSQSTTMSATQRALNLFVPVTESTTQKTTIATEVGPLDESSGQEPATTALVDKDLLRSVLATKLSKLFTTDLEQPKVAKTIIPNKMKGPPKTTEATTTLRQKSETIKTGATKQSTANLSSTAKTETSISPKSTSKPTPSSTTKTKTTSSTTQTKTTLSTTQKTTTQASTILKITDQTKKANGSVKIPSVSLQTDDDFIEEYKQETQEIPAVTHHETASTTRLPNNVLDGTVVKRRRVLSNFVKNPLHRSFGLIRRRRQITNSTNEIQPPTTTPLSTTPQRDAIQAQELEPRTTTSLPLDEVTNATTTSSTDSSTNTSTVASKLNDGEFRDIALSETAAGVSDQKQGLVKENEASIGRKTVNLELEEFQSVSTVAPTQPPVRQPISQFQPVAQQQGWAPPAPALPPQQAGFIQPTFNHFVIGNRRFVIPSITYEQHLAQQQQFWPQQEFVPPPQPVQQIPQQPTNFQQFVPQNPTPQNPFPQNVVQSQNQLPPTTSQRPILPATTEAPLLRTTEPVFPNIIHTSTPPARPHVRGVGEKGVDFDLYDEVGSANRQ